ncbi:MAG: hypothetical protein A2V98_24270 [Planctomycetes bacterium RBG_16_64_12]|nr:MAG: hypothetical protein A2V98_24270 [Planctomycetes bacterium RBG_16_64_12]
MKFKIDENLPVAAAVVLSDAGHESKTVHDQRLVGGPDRRLAEVCRDERRALVTLDLDFSDIRAYPPADYPGIVVLRPRVQERRPILDLLRSILPLLHAEELEGHLWIVERTGIRIRGGTSGGEKPR